MRKAPGVVIACGRCSLWSVKRFLVVKTNPLFRNACHLLQDITLVVSAWDLVSDAIATSAGPTASVTIAAGTVEAAVVGVAVEVSGGGNGGSENRGRRIHLNRCLRVKAIFAMAR